MIIKIVKFFFLLSTVCLVFLLDCNRSSDPADRKESLSIVLPFAFDNQYNPVENQRISLSPLYINIYGRLFKYDRHFQLRPYLIDRFYQRDKLVTFYIRKDAFFSNGQPITADDVEWSIKSVLQSENCSFETFIKGTEEFIQNKTSQLDGFKKLSDKSFTITLIKNNKKYLNYFASIIFSILPKGFFNEKPIFSGIYQVSKQTIARDRIILRLTTNPYSFIRPHINSIDLSFARRARNGTTFFSDVESGTPDIFLNFDSMYLKKISDAYTLYKIPMAGKFFIMVNPTKGFFKARKNRLLFRNFLNQLNLRKMRELAIISPPKNILPYSLQGYSIFKPINLNSSGESICLNKSVNIKVINNEFGIKRHLFKHLKGGLKKLNIILNIEWTDFDGWNNNFNKGDYEITSFYYSVNYPLSEDFYRNIFFPKGELHPSGYHNPVAMLLFERLEKTTNSLDKLKILWDMEKIARDESFLFPIFNTLILCGYKNDKVAHFFINNLFEINFEKLTFKNGD